MDSGNHDRVTGSTHALRRVIWNFCGVQLARYVMASQKLHADDTPLPVLDPGRGRTKTGRLWTYVLGYQRERVCHRKRHARPRFSILMFNAQAKI